MVKSYSKNDVPVRDLHEAYTLNAETGEIFWKKRFSNACKMGVPVGTVGGRGYLVCRLNDRLMYVHRIVWAMVHGEWPADCLDHKDGTPLNNHPNNLRLCNKSQNNSNRRMDGRNTSGFKGVYWDKSKGKWASRVSFENKNYFLGRFEDINDAVAARDEAVARLHGEFALLSGEIIQAQN